jgi:CBS domain-containing protein
MERRGALQTPVAAGGYIMRVGEIMATNVERVRPDDTIQEAAFLMKERNIGLLPVCDLERFVGMVTDRDIAIRAVAAGRDPKSTRVHAVMTPDFICCHVDDEVDDAARLMRERRVRRIVVLDSRKYLVGILSLGDLAAADHNPCRAGEVLQAVTEPTVPV